MRDEEDGIFQVVCAHPPDKDQMITEKALEKEREKGQTSFMHQHQPTAPSLASHMIICLKLSFKSKAILIVHTNKSVRVDFDVLLLST